jgi:hypothetical protein
MAGNRTGLHRRISAIFEGVPLPNDARSVHKPGRSDFGLPKPPASYPQTLTVPEPQQPVQQPPKPAPDKLLKGDAAIQKTKASPHRRFRKWVADMLLAPVLGGDAKQKVELILVLVLLTLLSFVLIRPLSMSPRNVADLSANQPAQARVTANSDIVIDWQTPPIYPTGLRDPTKPSSSLQSEAEAGRLIVRGIVHDNYEPYAIIGTQIVQEGDIVLGAAVVKINQGSVEFEMDGRRWTQEIEAAKDN